MRKFIIFQSDFFSKHISKYFAFTIWLTSGLVLNHLLWAFSFDLSGFESVNALPNRIISIYLIYSLIPLLWLFSVFVIGIFVKYYKKRPLFLVTPFLITEICFQFFGRGLIKAVINGILFIISMVYLAYEKYYDVEEINSLNKESLKLIHGEIVSFIRISVTIATFILGIAGVSFALNFMKEYYKEISGQFKMWWYGIMIIYAGLGMIYVVLDLANKAIRIRKIFIDKDKV
jgi:magnesium-transporting ATPase (P-type)